MIWYGVAVFALALFGVGQLLWTRRYTRNIDASQRRRDAIYARHARTPLSDLSRESLFDVWDAGQQADLVSRQIDYES